MGNNNGGVKKYINTDNVKDKNTTTTTTANEKSSINEIDDLFNQKKEHKKQQKQNEINEKERIKNVKAAAKACIPKNRNEMTNINKNEWIDDGLGGVFNHEGFTGRRQKDDESNVKIYKAHLMNKPGFGTTKDCPFDCDCCYI